MRRSILFSSYIECKLKLIKTDNGVCMFHTIGPIIYLDKKRKFRLDRNFVFRHEFMHFVQWKAGWLDSMDSVLKLFFIELHANLFACKTWKSRILNFHTLLAISYRSTAWFVKQHPQINFI